MQPHIKLDELIVATSSTDEGTSQQYLPLAFPATAHVDVVAAFSSADKPSVLSCGHCSLQRLCEVESQLCPCDANCKIMQQWIDGGTLCSEMEAATLFVVACPSVPARFSKRWHPLLDNLCKTSVEALRAYSIGCIMIIEIDLCFYQHPYR